MSPSEYMTADELAAHLSVSVHTVRWWGSTGRGPASVLLSPRVRRWRRADVDAWLADLEHAQRASA